jgi:hypothetical protein
VISKWLDPARNILVSCPVTYKNSGNSPTPGHRAQEVRCSFRRPLRSKKAAILALLGRPDGATLAELMAATGWQEHSARGFISGTLGKKMGLAVESAKRDKERVYSIAK